MQRDRCLLLRGSRGRRALLAFSAAALVCATASLTVMSATAPAVIIRDSWACDWINHDVLVCNDLFDGTEWECSYVAGTLRCLWSGHGPQPATGDQKALEDALALDEDELPARPAAAHSVSISTNYDPNGPHKVTVTAGGARSSAGASWGITVTISGMGQETQSCSSGSTSCTAVASAYLSPFEMYNISASVTSAGATRATAYDGVYASCD
jgi:hypothetical protein